jgi:hypothetical protein
MLGCYRKYVPAVGQRENASTKAAVDADQTTSTREH